MSTPNFKNRHGAPFEKVTRHDHTAESRGGKIPFAAIEGVNPSGLSGSIAYTDLQQTWTATQIFAPGSYTMFGDAGGATGHDGLSAPVLYTVGWAILPAPTTYRWLAPVSPTGGDCDITWPDLGAAGAATPAFVDFAQSWTALQTFGANASLNASCVTAGTLPVARGGTGATASTGSGNVVLATSPTLTTPTIADLTNIQHDHLDTDDGGTLTIAAIPSGVWPITQVYDDVCRLTADQSTTSSTLADVHATEAELSVSASTNYHFRWIIPWTTDLDTNGIKLAVTCPAGATIYYSGDIHMRGAVAANTSGAFHGMGGTSGGEAITATSASDSSIPNLAYVEGLVMVAGTAGTINLQFASDDGVNSSYVLAGATGFLLKLP